MNEGEHEIQVRPERVRYSRGPKQKSFINRVLRAARTTGHVTSLQIVSGRRAMWAHATFGRAPHQLRTHPVKLRMGWLAASSGVARETARTEADTIVLAGVNFMADAAKPLNPDKTVLLPDLSRLARGVDRARGRAAAARGAPAFQSSPMSTRRPR